MNDQVTATETAEILRLATEALDCPGDFVELGCYRGDTSVLLGKLLVENRRSPSEDALAQSSEATPGFLTAKPAENSTKSCGKPVDNPVENLSSPETKFLWIYDSFAGLPEKSREDSSGAGANFQKGELFVSKREVVEKLRRHGLKTASHLEKTAGKCPAGPVVIVKKAWFSDLIADDLPREIAFAFLDGDLYDSIKVSLRLVLPRLTKQGIIIVHDYNNPELPGSARAVDEFLRAHSEFCLAQKHTLAILRRKC